MRSLAYAVALLAVIMTPFVGNLCMDPFIPCVPTSPVDYGEGLVLITGASAGIGRQTALLYAERGARLLLTARREAELKSLQRECLALGAAEAIVVAADVSNTSAILAPLAATRRTLALLLLNHAYIPLQLVAEAASEPNLLTFNRVIQTNFVASAQLLHESLPYLAEDARVGIVGSMGTAFFPGFLSAYVASKAALIAFAEVYRLELELAGRSAASVSILYLGEISTENHMAETGADPNNPLMISPHVCAAGIMRALDRRLTDAYIPWFMGPLGSSLGKLVPLRATLFESGFLTGKPELLARVGKIRADGK